MNPEQGLLDMYQEITEITTDTAAIQTQDQTTDWGWYHFLVLIPMVIYMFLPVLSMRLDAPGQIRQLADLCVAIMVILAMLRMLQSNKIPGAFLVILAATIIGSVTASFEGQSAGTTLWGWWLMFRFPMVGLYVYLLPGWGRNIARVLPTIALWFAVIQVVVQILNYATGIPVGDHLSGTFGRFGVAQLFLLFAIAISIALGKWLVLGKWQNLILILLLGVAASALAELKLYPIIAILLGFYATIIYLIREGIKVSRIAVFLLLYLAIAVGFVFVYNSFTSEEMGAVRIESYLEEESRDQYLDRNPALRDSVQVYRFGRNFEVSYGWQLMQRDLPAFLFGTGIGTRRVSEQFGLVGASLVDSIYGLRQGRSLLVTMQEMGLFGLALLGFFVVGTSIVLFRGIGRDDDSYMDILRYGMIFFSALWPIWFWYVTAWELTTPGIVYWFLWGYVMHFTTGESTRIAKTPDIAKTSDWNINSWETS